MAGRKKRGRGRGYSNGGHDRGRSRGHGRGRGRGGPGYVAIYDDDGDLAIDTMNFRMSNLSRHP
jgi:hypothetical protein